MTVTIIEEESIKIREGLELPKELEIENYSK